ELARLQRRADVGHQFRIAVAARQVVAVVVQRGAEVLQAQQVGRVGAEVQPAIRRIEARRAAQVDAAGLGARDVFELSRGRGQRADRHAVLGLLGGGGGL